MSPNSFFQRTIFLLVIISSFKAPKIPVVLSQFVSSEHRQRNSGDATCICGIDSALLEKLETILRALPVQSCPAPTQISSGETSSPNQAGEFVSDTKPSTGSRPTILGHNHSSQVKNEDPAAENREVESHAKTGSQPKATPLPSKQQGSEDQQEHQIHKPQFVSSVNSEDTRHEKRPNEHEDNLSVGSITSKPTEASKSTATGAQTTTQRPIQEETQVRPPLPLPSSDSNSDSPESSRENTNTGFLNGMTISPISSHNQALAKLNQSSSNVNEKDMTSALESTVPNLVSNIFSNIKNLTLQTEQNPDRPQSSTLTSIDGSSMDVHGDSKDQITADGEKLFDIWLEHQIESLNLTATMAGHIRKSAGILFRRIIKQYVDRVERMGGRVEQNIQRATQMALNNTQTLIAFLLKNYVNFAAGIMQILGEQVSRVGKQIDSTGDTIAHLSLNPFDIISSVIETLPNPSDYSGYFRNFGKQLLGDVVAFSNGGGSSSSQQSTGSQSGQQNGLITKTIGAIGKFGSWFG